MEIWEIFAIAGLIFVILEMVVPSMFFLNLAVAGFLTAICALFTSSWVILLSVFVVLSILSIAFLRPLLLRNKDSKEKETGMEGKYIGQIVKVKEPVGKFSGAITIYDERWEARAEVDEPIPEGSEVRIVKYDSLVLTVERI
jgi:membrane protein implicated in regulation of membrane protease activity